jgi:hypothetical protein
MSQRKKQSQLEPRVFPLPAGQTDWFESSAYAGVQVAPSKQEDGGLPPDTVAETVPWWEESLVEQRVGRAGDEARERNRSHRNREKEETAAAPVTPRKRSKISLRERAKACARQAKCRAKKRENGYKRIETWVPQDAGAEAEVLIEDSLDQGTKSLLAVALDAAVPRLGEGNS